MTHPCSKCAAAKPCDAFYSDKSKRCGHHTICRECVKAHHRARYDADPTAARESMRRYYHANRQRFVTYSRKRLYSLTDEQYDAMLAAQDGRCATCQSTEKLHIDHDHDTGRVRGLLCNNCNRGLGLLGDDAATLMRAAAYITGLGTP